METVFRVLDNPDGEKIGEFLKSLDCPIEVRIEPECNAIPYEDWTDEQRDKLAKLVFGEDNFLDDFIAERMKDPIFRFWWYFYKVWDWPITTWYKLTGRLRQWR